jgi:ferredoxin
MTREKTTREAQTVVLLLCGGGRRKQRDAFPGRRKPCSPATNLQPPGMVPEPASSGVAMHAEDIERLAAEFTEQDERNSIPAAKAFAPAYAGMRIYGTPIFGYARATDPGFLRLRASGIIGSHFMPPPEWLPGARSVIAFFLPFTRRVKESNARNMAWPSEEWLHARIEGQECLAALAAFLGDALRGAGYGSVVPSSDRRFRSVASLPTAETPATFTSNWSERHVAYVCGLGTFGLSKGLITRLGIAGRFGSLVTTLELPPTPHAYADPYEYCSKCGACAVNCPVGAISVEQGKQHVPCKQFLDQTRQAHSPYYGCGKCQVAVPCRDRIPPRRAGAR